MKNKRGISLIVLVITIIVMVILVGAVVMTLENTGITNQSKKAKDKTNYAQEITRLEVIKNGILTDNLGKITVAEYIAELTNKGIIEGTVTDNADGSKTFTTDTGAEVTITQNGPRDILIKIAGYTEGNNQVNNLITFAISDVTYQAEEGMTWEAWVDSGYNSGNLFVNGTGVAFMHSNGVISIIDPSNGNFVLTTDTIRTNTTYGVMHTGGGGGEI